jgi:hypothetical protein
VVLDLKRRLKPISHDSFSILVNKNEKCLSSHTSEWSFHMYLNVTTSLLTMARSSPKPSVPASLGEYPTSSYIMLPCKFFWGDPAIRRLISSCCLSTMDSLTSLNCLIRSLLACASPLPGNDYTSSSLSSSSIIPKLSTDPLLVSLCSSVYLTWT